MPAIATPQLRLLYRRLGAPLGLSAQTIHDRVIRSLVLASYSRVTLRTGVPASVRDYLLERQERFPGLHVERTYLRRYPQHELAAQLLGTVGEIDPGELGLRRFQGVVRGQIVGKDGIEKTYDRYLRGTDGQSRIVVDALGRPKRQYEATKPQQGRTVQLSLDADLQKAGQQALQKAIASTPGVAGAFVALDPRNGSVLAMGSEPSFDPSILSRPITKRRYDQELGQAARVAELQPRDRRRLSHRLDVQADHLAGGPLGRPHHAGLDDQRPRASSPSAAASGRTPSGPRTAA